MPLNLKIDDVLRFKKPHACGENAWRVYRVGGEVGMTCLGCQRMVMPPRREFERKVRRVIRNGEVLKPDEL